MLKAAKLTTVQTMMNPTNSSDCDPYFPHLVGLAVVRRHHIVMHHISINSGPNHGLTSLWTSLSGKAF